MRKFHAIPIGFLLFAVWSVSFATTWTTREIQCPLCKKMIQVEVIMSYGSYIYRWPSKFQMIFWPGTTDNYLYFCKHCHLTAYMDDLEKIPDEKFDAVREAIEPLVKAQPDQRYYAVPMDYRLEIAEAVYRTLDRDDSFWCRFYRIKGYHLERAGQSDAAAAARMKALALAETMLSAEKSLPPPKELTLIVGSMQYFTGRKEAALSTLEKVKHVPVEISGAITEETAKNATVYLDELAEEFLSHIKAGKPLPE